MLAKFFLAGAFATAAVAQGVSSVLFFTRVPNPVTAGQPQAITFSTNDSSTPVKILLRKGVSTNLHTVATLTSDASDGQYIWTPDDTLDNASDYALQISQGSQVNYYGPFTLQGAGQASSSSSSSSTSSLTSSATSSRSTSAVHISPNSTRTTIHPPFATGNATHNNTTLTSATRTPTTTSKSSTQTSSDSGAAFQGTSTSANAPTNTNAAAIMATGSGAITILFGAVAAMLFC